MWNTSPQRVKWDGLVLFLLNPLISLVLVLLDIFYTAMKQWVLPLERLDCSISGSSLNIKKNSLIEHFAIRYLKSEE